jgi:hypothetical protein
VGTGVGSNTEDDAQCDDGDQCTIDLCDAAAGCITSPADGQPCDDGDACTVNTTCQAGACAGGVVLDCDDGNVCTDETCDPAAGCVFTNNTDPCDDGDECTIGDVCSGGTCVPGPDTCPPTTDIVCTFDAATAGEVVTCELRIAAVNESATTPGTANAVDQATGLQFNVSYNPTLLSAINFFDDQCFPAAGCFELAASGPGAFPLSPTGHSISINPSPVSSWTGTGGVVIVNLSNPTIPLSPAYYDGTGTLQGNPAFVKLKFTVNQNLTPANVAEVKLLSPLAANATPKTLDTTINLDGVILTELP